MIFGDNVTYCYNLFIILVWTVSDKRNYFIETKFFVQMVLFFPLFFRGTQRIWRQNRRKNKKTKRSSFCIQNNLFRWCCFLVVALLLFFFPFLWWTTRHCRIGYTTCLPCLWMWNYSDTHSSSNICLRRFYLLTSSQSKQSTQKVYFCILQGPT